jgi:repressor of nif and glnA expression
MSLRIFVEAILSEIVFASHDNDRKIPRTPKEIRDLNTMIATEMKSIFSKKGIPVVPSLGGFGNSHPRERLTQS